MPTWPQRPKCYVSQLPATLFYLLDGSVARAADQGSGRIEHPRDFTDRRKQPETASPQRMGITAEETTCTNKFGVRSNHRYRGVFITSLSAPGPRRTREGCH